MQNAVSSSGPMLRGALLHLGMNMWGDYRAPGEPIDPN